MAENIEGKSRTSRKPKTLKDAPVVAPSEILEEVENSPEILPEPEVISPEVEEISSEKVEELGAAASQLEEEVVEEQPTVSSEEEEKDIEPESAEIAKLNPNLPDNRSKWVARLVAKKGYHILFKGSFDKAYRAADNYNKMHGFPANKVRRVR